MLRRLSVYMIFIVLLLTVSAASAQTFTNAGTFTYQGYLERNNTGLTGSCNFTFAVFDAVSGGNQIGNMQNANNVAVTNGVFSANLNFGAAAFANGDRYLQISVQCAGDNAAITLSPRQPINPSPVAMALPGLYTQPNSTSPNVLGGYNENAINNGVVGATIAGGGVDRALVRVLPAPPRDGDAQHFVYDNYGTIGGGAANRVGSNDSDVNNGPYATVGGGLNNTAGNTYAVVSGGSYNSAGDRFTSVGGGTENQVFDAYGTIGGGTSNEAGSSSSNSPYATVGGGELNRASGLRSTVAGGTNNRAGGTNATVGGGERNQASGQASTVGGGTRNRAQASHATIAGGGPTNLNPNFADATANVVFDDYGTIGGGGNNRAGSNDGNTQIPTNATYATVGGGRDNAASGQFSAIPGGQLNLAAGDYSLAAGQTALISATADNTFLWADGTFSGTFINPRQFIAIATGGVEFYTGTNGNNLNGATGVILAANSGTWSAASDRALKSNIEDVNSIAVLEAVAQMPISTWNYTAQGEDVLHMGPMAQDFHAAFGLGIDDRHIDTVDADGVSLAAIQGLYMQNREQSALIEQQQEQIDALEERLSALENGTSPAMSGGVGLQVIALLLIAGGVWFNRLRTLHQESKKDGNTW
ncbi:MAG: tail fiber domain-containing protein [Chloroflexota bacterium]